MREPKILGFRIDFCDATRTSVKCRLFLHHHAEIGYQAIQGNGDLAITLFRCRLKALHQLRALLAALGRNRRSVVDSTAHLSRRTFDKQCERLSLVQEIRWTPPRQV